MALKLLINHAWHECAEFKVTNGSDVETADTLVQNMVGGARHMTFTQSGTAGLRFVYVNKQNKLSFDTFVMVNASRHSGHAFQLISVSSYPGTLTQHINSSNWAPTLVNGGRDFVSGGYSVSGVDAVGIVLDSGSGGAYTKALNQLFFARAITLTYDLGQVIQPVWTEITMGRNRYHVDERRTFQCSGLTQAEANAINAAVPYLQVPCFIWDDSALHFEDTLYHCIVRNVTTQQLSNDLYRASFEVFRLRRYA